MNEWSVAVTVEPHRPGSEAVPDGQVADLAEALADHAPAISTGRAELTLRIAWKATDAGAAVAGAVPAILDALRHAGWRDPLVRKLEVTHWMLFEEELQEATYPDLVGISEIAELLGTSRQRASELARSPKFPAAHAELAAGPVWLRPNITRFIQHWDRRPGRPRAKTSAHVGEEHPARTPAGEPTRA
jgi:hypothetical protein